MKALVYFIGLLLIGLAWWTNKYFGIATIDQAVYTIRFGMDGALTADQTFIKRLLFWSLLLPFIFTVVFIWLEKILASRLAHKTNSPFKWKLHYIVLAVGISYVSYQYSIPQFVQHVAHNDIDYYKTHYADPRKMTFRLVHPKSLVMIYVESLENTYSDPNLFGHDLLQRLNQQKKTGISFANYKTMLGTDWTIAGIVATQCGLPLQSLTIFGGNKQGSLINHFLLKAKCLGDILSEHGYTNIFMKGAALDFAGTGKFFSDHHYTQIYGREEWLAQGIKLDDMNYWGLYDDDLFKQAKIRLGELIRQNKLFNLTLLTVDTHGPNGYISKTCKQQGAHEFAGIVECTANQLSDFVDYVKAKGWLTKVNIVIVGDHVAMKNPVFDKLKSHQVRTIFNLMVMDRNIKKTRDEIVGFDLLPSILESLGFQYAGNRIGLGYSAFKPGTYRPEGWYDEMFNGVMGRSETYNELW